MKSTVIFTLFSIAVVLLFCESDDISLLLLSKVGAALAVFLLTWLCRRWRLPRPHDTTYAIHK